MAEYDINFGEKLATVAKSLVTNGIEELDAQRTVLYLGLLSAEITLKAMLEQAGKPVTQIRGRSHKLSELLADLGECKVEVEVASELREWVPATRLRSYTLDDGGKTTTVGNVLEAESQGASEYPNKVRYGDLLSHFPPEVVVEMAEQVAAFARQHWQSIRI